MEEKTNVRDGGTAMRDKKMALIHFWERPENLAVLIMWRQSLSSLDEIAKQMRITKKTLIAYMRESEKIRNALRFGKLQAIAIADAKLMEQVKNGNMEAIKYFNKHRRRSVYDNSATGLDDEALENDEGLFDIISMEYEDALV